MDVHVDPTLVQLSTSSNIDAYVSGSTGVFSILKGNKLLIGNVGDSRAVLGRRTRTGVRALELSNDQKPDRWVRMCTYVVTVSCGHTCSSRSRQ